ncbi:AAA family ATPase [Cohnella sp. CFH 77786]|uniref:AAA family ATPase n=1 Tax=Cohnella sp. CFH 77786 TaxID=2662265 RepID=UPI001C60D598|nr:AAA family ATPase [Cohnella sp. CFH 77786]MBW5445120.1 AAA family ATPase [Cohnella sp. CFH 77786]
MYIRELRAEGFGPLRNAAVTFETPVTVVFGPNEAGKSSLLRFIRSMLYGIPTRKDPVERGEPVNGGRHGGRMSVLARDGRVLAVERYADGSGRGRRAPSGPLVRDAEGHELRWTQAEWERHVLGGVSERLFRQLFSVSLDELHELLTLQGDEIGNFLYHAGLAGGASLAEARRKLAGEMDKLYRPKGTNQEMNRLLALIQEIEAEIRQSRGAVAAFQEASMEIARVRARLEELDIAIPRLAEKTAEARGALDARELWLRLRVLLAEEREWALRLPDPAAPPLPEEAAAEWAVWLERKETAYARLRKTEALVRERRKEREGLRWDERLLTHAGELDKLEAMREAAAARSEESESVASELRLLDDALETLLRRLSPDWHETDLEAFAAVTAEREPLRRLQQAWEEAGRAHERLEADAGRIRRQREALRAEMKSSRQGGSARASHRLESEAEASPFGPFRPQSRESLQLAWNALEDEVRMLARARYDAMLSGVEVPSSASAEYGGARVPERRRAAGARGAGSAQASGRIVRIAVSILAGAASILLVTGAMLGFPTSAAAPAFLAGAAAMAALSAAAGWTGSKKGKGPSSPAGEIRLAERAAESRRRAEERLRELFADPVKAAEALFGGEPDPAEPLSDEAWRRMRQAVQDKLAALERSELDAVREQEWQRRLSELDREFEALRMDLERNASRSEELQAEWTEWVRTYKLPLSLAPDSLPELLGLAEQAQTALRRRARAVERRHALEQYQSAFRETGAALFAAYPPPPSLASDPVLAVSWLYRFAEEQRAVKEQAERADRALREAEAEETEARLACGEAEAGMLAVLRQAGAADEAEYAQRLRIDERRRALTRERREIELRIEAGRTTEAAASLYGLLESHDEASLSALCRNAEEAWQAAERERTELLDRKGRLGRELERLREDADSEDRLLRLAEWEGKLERLAERYAVLAVSDRLLQETKAVYEEERQPEVLRLASRYFAAMTGGAYTRIAVPADTPSVLAETTDRQWIDSAYLSRGTQEQLYLAMRFALADAASKDVPLPLLLDDLFVHFDERRLRQTVPVLAEISRTRQVILFTCHRHVAEAVRRDLPAARVIDWEARREEPRSEARGPGSSGTASPG